MRKYFILALIAAGLISFSAQALIEQSASKALSLNNTVNNSGNKGLMLRHEKRNKDTNETKPEISSKTLDMRNSVTQNVSLEQTQKLIVVLSEKDGQSWKVNYDSGKVAKIANSLNGKNREVTFSQTSSKDSTLYFDCIGKDGEVIQNKAVYIKVR